MGVTYKYSIRIMTMPNLGDGYRGIVPEAVRTALRFRDGDDYEGWWESMDTYVYDGESCDTPEEVQANILEKLWEASAGFVAVTVTSHRVTTEDAVVTSILDNDVGAYGKALEEEAERAINKGEENAHQ